MSYYDIDRNSPGSILTKFSIDTIQLKEFSKSDPILESFKNLDNYKDYKLDDDVFEQKIIDLVNLFILI